VAAGELVVDVGAGSGMLTRELLRAGAEVLAIEPDTRLAARLRRACPSATVAEREALAAPWPREPFRVVANLPFAHAAGISRSLLTDPRVPVVAADVIVEWDFAVKRARLWPSTALGVIWGAWYDLRVARRLEPGAFARGRRSPPPFSRRGGAPCRWCPRARPRGTRRSSGAASGRRRGRGSSTRTRGRPAGRSRPAAAVPLRG